MLERFVNIVLKSKAEEINKTDNHFFSFLTSPPIQIPFQRFLYIPKEKRVTKKEFLITISIHNQVE